MPHILALAREHKLPICFVRVKRVKQRDVDEWLEKYLADLRSCITAQGGLYYDETDDPEITWAMYGNGDHIAEKYKPFVTERFYRGVKSLLE